MGRNMKLGCCFIAVTFMILAAGCGGSSSDTSGSGGITITGTVSTPTGTASVSARPGKSVTEEVSGGVEVRCEDMSGTLLGTATTATDGSFSFSGLTSAQVNSGVVLEANGNLLQTLHIPEAAEITAGTVPMTVNAESSFVYAVTSHQCGDNLATCDATTDVNGLIAAAMAFVGNESPVAGTTSGDAEAALMALADLIMRGNNAAALLMSAFNGDPTGLVAALGTDTVANTSVAVADAMTGTITFAAMTQAAYLTRDSSTGQSPIETIEANTGTTLDMAAVVAPFAYLTHDEFSNFEAEDFRGYMQNLPYVTTSAFTNNTVQEALAQQFRLGTYSDPAMAGIAVAAFAATIPSDTSTLSTTYDPTTAAYAAANVYLYYVNNGGDTSASPAAFASSLGTAMSNPTYMASFAYGGSQACGTYIDSIIAGTVPDPSAIPSASGGSCTSSQNCITGYTCSSGSCSSWSSKVGTACTDDSYCDSLTVCYGATYGGHGACMVSASLPTGAAVLTTSGTQSAGTTYTPPSGGTEGSTCGAAGQAPCSAGLTCFGGTYGMCMNSATMTSLGPGVPCTANSQCASSTCTGGLCAAGGSSGTYSNGTACGSNMQCTSGCCKYSLCAQASDCSYSGGGSKANGESCTTNGECTSSLCCRPSLNTCGSTCELGSYCTQHSQCTSSNCNMMMGMCGSM